MPITLFVGDEQPVWQATITNNGSLVDYSSGYTFTCVVTTKAGATLLTKTTGITGATGGVVTVAFTGAELAAGGVTAAAGDVGQFDLYLTPRRISDSADGPTVKETLTYRWKP